MFSGWHPCLGVVLNSGAGCMHSGGLVGLGGRVGSVAGGAGVVLGTGGGAASCMPSVGQIWAGVKIEAPRLTEVLCRAVGVGARVVGGWGCP